MSFVLNEVSGLNVLFQSEGFKLHKLYPELLRVTKMFALNFMKNSHVRDCQLCALPIDDSSTWNSPEQIYPGLEANDTMKLLLPHQKESFLIRCRDWYREAIKQLYLRLNFNDPVLKAVQFLHPTVIVEAKASISAVASIATGLPRLTSCLGVAQQLDRQWRSLLVDTNVITGGWERASLEQFWLAMSNIDFYASLAKLVLNITALPQSTAVVERTFSKINLNKTKLRNGLEISTLEAICKVSEWFSENFNVTTKLAHLHGKARNSYMEKYSSVDRDVVENEHDIIFE